MNARQFFWTTLCVVLWLGPMAAAWWFLDPDTFWQKMVTLAGSIVWFFGVGLVGLFAWAAGMDNLD